MQTQRRRLPLAPLKGASPLFLENRRGDGPCLPSSNPPSSVMLAGQLLGINPQTPAQVALAPSSRPKPPPMPVAPCMSGGRGRIPDRESQGSQRTRWWREVNSNPRSRAKRTTARHCFLVPFVTTPVLPKGLILPRPGDHSGRYAKRRSAVSVAVPEPFLFGTIVKRRWLTWWRLKRCSSRW